MPLHLFLAHFPVALVVTGALLVLGTLAALLVFVRCVGKSPTRMGRSTPFCAPGAHVILFRMNGLTLLPTKPRHGTPFRLASLLLAAVFLLLGTGEGFGRPHCPHHDGIPGAQAAAPTSMHMGGHAATHAPEGHAPSHAEHGACTCPGACLAGGATPLPAEGPAFVAAWAPIQVREETPEPAEHLPGRTPYVLPFAHAPPRVG